MTSETLEDVDKLEGKQVDCVQSILRTGGNVLGFTIRFTDGTLLKVDSGDLGDPLKIEVTHESRYMSKVGGEG